MTHFHAWLAKANPGDSVIYYTGHLAADRDPLAPRTAALNEADAAWSAYESGLVNLVQRAHDPRDSNGAHAAFSYIAQRR